MALLKRLCILREQPKVLQCLHDRRFLLRRTLRLLRII